MPHAKLYTYLDDRLAIVGSWQEMQTILDVTNTLDKALGPVLNFGKCHRAVFCKKGRPKPPTPQGLLANIRVSRSFRYLGVDIVSDGNAARKVALRRTRDFSDRCGFIRILKRHQRGVLVADAKAALWLAGVARAPGVPL